MSLPGKKLPLSTLEWSLGLTGFVLWILLAFFCQVDVGVVQKFTVIQNKVTLRLHLEKFNLDELFHLIPNQDNQFLCTKDKQSKIQSTGEGDDNCLQHPFTPPFISLTTTTNLVWYFVTW